MRDITIPHNNIARTQRVRAAPPHMPQQGIGHGISRTKKPARRGCPQRRRVTDGQKRLSLVVVIFYGDRALM